MNQKLTTQQIGKCGELLVQYHLLQNGVESAPMTTDSGIDLVAYSAKNCKAITIQVKTNLKAKPGGGIGKPSIDWWVPQDLNAELFAFVELSQENIWLVKNREMNSMAQQNPEGRYHFFMVLDQNAKDRKDNKKFRLLNLKNISSKTGCAAYSKGHPINFHRVNSEIFDTDKLQRVQLDVSGTKHHHRR